jgi:hypothetical protein
MSQLRACGEAEERERRAACDDGRLRSVDEESAPARIAILPSAEHTSPDVPATGPNMLACRQRRENHALTRPLLAIFCIAATPAYAQSAKGSADHIRAATGRIDGNAIRANERATADWPSYGLDYAETRFSRLKQVNAAT